MKSILQLLLLVLTFEATAQTTLSEISSREKIVGKDLRTNAEIKGIEYEFKDYITNVYTDTTSGLITLQTRNAIDDRKLLTNDGVVAVYDPAVKKILWSTGINSEKGSLYLMRDLIVESNQYDGLHFLDLKNGKTVWETKNVLYYYDPVKRIGLTHSSKTKETNTVAGIDLTSGNEFWTRQLNYENKWYEFLNLNDSVVAVVTSGLHTLNLYTGKGWDYDFAASGKSKHHIASNIVFHNSRLYIATKEKLVCLDKAGKVIWNVDLPADLMSTSTLFIKNENLYLVNRGIIDSGSGRAIYGKPFFAGYDLKDGHQKFHTPIAKKDFISGLEIQGQHVSIMLGNSIMKYSLNDGQLITIKNFELNGNEMLRSFVNGLTISGGPKVFVKTPDLTFHNVISYTTKQFVITTRGRVLILDSQLKIDGQLTYGDLYIQFGSFEGFKFLNNGENVHSTIIVDEKNKSVAEIEASYGAVLLNKILYDPNGKKFIELDLRSVLVKEN